VSHGCPVCGVRPNRVGCPSCTLYDAAVEAGQIAARSIARARVPGMRRAWLNLHGIFAEDAAGTVRQIGTAEEAAPFANLTTEARAVSVFYVPPAPVVRPRRGARRRAE
jgi:hypothetical protein